MILPRLSSLSDLQPSIVWSSRKCQSKRSLPRYPIPPSLHKGTLQAGLRRTKPVKAFVPLGRAMLSWFKTDKRRKSIREDRKYIVARARRFLTSYLASNDLQKQQYYELITGAADACRPRISDPHLKNTELSKLIAETALKVVKVRHRRAQECKDHLQELITDAYSTVAIAYRRAAAVYVHDEEMQQIGTAAVHLVTIANSYMAAQSPDTASPTSVCRKP